MHIRAAAMICAVRLHGEQGAVVRVLTHDHGLLSGYVPGARSRTLRPVLLPGNHVLAELRSRVDAQLPSLSCELVTSIGPQLGEPLAAAAIQWATVLVAVGLSEGQPYPRIYAGLDGLLGAIAAAPSARGWGAALVMFELLLLAELGFGLDLDVCVATGATSELLYVSPRSGRAVSAAAARGLETRLLPLPAFLRGGISPGWPDILAGLRLTGHFLHAHVLSDQRARFAAARDRLVSMLEAAA